MQNPKFALPSFRSLFRALLRESSYLPDPVARAYVHDYVIQRFRRYQPLRKGQDNVLWKSARRRSALNALSTLSRANEGYSKPLEKVLRLAYGRTGKRRRQLLESMISPDIPPDNLAVAGLVKESAMFEDGWQPPSAVIELLKSQTSNYAIKHLGVRCQVKHYEPQIPAYNAWMKPVAASRRRNIRMRWYTAALDSLYPPLPDSDLKILEGLISGSIHWKIIERRKAVGELELPRDDLVDFLVHGPRKKHTFRAYTNGRPHNITRRFMRRLWRRILALVPRISWNEASQKRHIVWHSLTDPADLSIVVNCPKRDILLPDT